MMDRYDTLLRMDEAIGNIIVAKTEILFLGKNSEHVQQARFEQFVRSMDEIVESLVEYGGNIVKEIEEGGEPRRRV